MESSTEPTEESFTTTVTNLMETSVSFPATAPSEYTATFQSTTVEGNFNSAEHEDITLPDNANVGTITVVPTSTVDSTSDGSLLTYSTTKQNAHENITSDITSTVDSLHGQKSSDSTTPISSETVINDVSPSEAGVYESGSTTILVPPTPTLNERVSFTSNGVLEQTNHTNRHSTDKINTTYAARSSAFSTQRQITSVTTNSTKFLSSTRNDVIIMTTNETPANIDCDTLIVVLSSVFVLVLMVISLGCLCGLWRIRKTWRQKLKEEKRKTDIWTTSTFNNTVVNENYIDFSEIAIQSMERGDFNRTGRSISSATSGTRRSSSATSGARTSAVSTDSSSNRTSVFGQRSSIVSRTLKLPSKLFVGRSKSSYSTDALAIQDPESRGRASTFAHGRRLKRGERDTHNLVDHIETDEEAHTMLESVDKILKPQNKHIVTEL